MFTFFIASLTVILVLNSLFLILLVLVQLPKKEAGIGMAFGGAATETLFGAGTGTVLTRATKYSAGLFMGLSLLLAVLNSHANRNRSTSLENELQRLSTAPGQSGMVTPALSNVVRDVPAPSTAAPIQVPSTEPLLLSNTNVTPQAPAPETSAPPTEPAP